MTPQELKNSVLQRAIQGKLVEQRPEEGTGEELYQTIQAEKCRLIQSGQLKKEKPLPEITEDEIPFDIPENWQWVRIGDVAIINPKNNLDNHADVSFVPMSCISDGFRNQHTFEIAKWGEVRRGFTHFAEGDVGIAKITPCFQNRKSVIFHGLKNGYGAGTTELTIVRAYNNFISHRYFLCFFKSDLFISNGVKSFTGTAGQQRIHKDYLKNCLFPLPPLAEQRRIVAKIEELTPYIDRYTAAWNRLEAFNKRFPSDMRKSLLQMAIQGKLVEQRPEEGTGEELYRTIQAEKQRLIKSGKIKKEKPLPEISDDEIPFDIPDSWMWIKLGSVVSVFGGKRLPVGETLTSENTGHKYIRISDMNETTVLQDRLLYVPRNVVPLIEKYIINKEDVYITVAGTIGKIGKIPASLDGANLTENADRLVFSLLNQDLLIYFLKSPAIQSQIADATTKVGQPKLAIKKIQNFLIPLPPLAEQRRIVARLKELLPLCESLK